jgi:iron complex transport system substrate-binding protein
MEESMSRRFLPILTLFALLALLAAPVAAQRGSPVTAGANITAGCAESDDPAVDYFPQEATVMYAEGFQISYYNNYKVILVNEPFADAGFRYEYVLVQCGTTLPEVIEGTQTIGYQVIEVPIQSIVTLSATFLPNLETIGELDALVANDEFDFVYSEAVRARIDAGEMVEVGFPSGIDNELVLDLNPDLIMLNAFSQADLDPLNLLRDEGIPYAANIDYLETSPLGRAEWVKFTAAFFNREEEANNFFTEVEGAYNQLTALTADAEARPTIMVNGLFGDTWFVSGGQSYVARLIADAGGDYLWADDEATGGVPLDFESVLERAADADIWINPNFWFTLADGLAEDERYAEFAPFASGQVYNNNARVTPMGGNDYYEGAVANPHLLLADLIAIFQPALLPDHELFYYQQLPAE